MELLTPDGSSVSFPDGTSMEVAKRYISTYYPAEPNIAERTIGHLSKGMAEVMKKVSNVGSYLTGEEPTAGPYQQFFENNPFASAVTAHPETSFLGQAAGGLAEFIPQVPIYMVGGRAALGLTAASKLPYLAKGAEALLTKAPTIMGRYGRAIARGTVEGGVVGTAIGTSAQTPIVEKLTEGGKEALGFGAATAVLHPVFSVLGSVGKGVVRRLGKKATPDSVEAKLKEKAETDPAAADDLQKLQEARASQPTEAEELYVPKGEETVVPSRLAQGELPLEPLPAETLTKFAELGYTEADLAGKSDKELIDILEGGVKNPNQLTFSSTIDSRGDYKIVGKNSKDEIVTTATASVSDGTAYLEDLYTREPFQRSGAMSKLHDYVLESGIAQKIDTHPGLSTEEGLSFYDKYRKNKIGDERVLQTDQTTLPTDEQIAKLKEALASTPVDYKAEAEALGLQFNGIQEGFGDIKAFRSSLIMLLVLHLLWKLERH
jgi:hypothetical protein